MREEDRGEEEREAELVREWELVGGRRGMGKEVGKRDGYFSGAVDGTFCSFGRGGIGVGVVLGSVRTHGVSGVGNILLTSVYIDSSLLIKAWFTRIYKSFDVGCRSSSFRCHRCLGFKVVW